MTGKELDIIMIRLQNAREQKKQIALTKAQAEIETIRREAEAYWDGVYDAIFLNIGSKEYSVEEKGAAIQMVCNMPTHNGINKDRMLDVIRWLLNLLFVAGVKTEHSNADRIRAMSDEELAEVIMCPYGSELDLCCTKGTCLDCCMKWLKEPAEEVKS